MIGGGPTSIFVARLHPEEDHHTDEGEESHAHANHNPELAEEIRDCCHGAGSFLRGLRERVGGDSESESARAVPPPAFNRTGVLPALDGRSKYPPEKLAAP